MIDEQAGAFFYMVNQFAADIGRHGRTAIAAADVPLALNEFFAYIICSVHHNAAAECIVVDPFFHTQQFERIAIAAFVGLAGYVEAETAFVRGGLVGEIRSLRLTGLGAMSHICII